MGQARVARGLDTRDIVTRAGGDPALATYNSEAEVLTAPGVGDAALAAARDSVVNRTGAAEPAQKRAKDAALRAAALLRHTDAILAADAEYQTKLAAVIAAATLAELDAIVP